MVIADEIAVGFGRTGRMFAFEHSGIDPDIVCLGKGLTGGCLPLSAAVVKESVHATFSDTPEDHTLYHGHTFAGNPIAAAAALACLDVYKEEGMVARAAALGVLLQDLMSPPAEMSRVANVRYLGLIGALELYPGPGDSTGAAAAQQVREVLLGQGILLRPLGNVLYLMPPLVINSTALAQLVAALTEAVAALQ